MTTNHEQTQATSDPPDLMMLTKKRKPEQLQTDLEANMSMDASPEVINGSGAEAGQLSAELLSNGKDGMEDHGDQPTNKINVKKNFDSLDALLKDQIDKDIEEEVEGTEGPLASADTMDASHIENQPTPTTMRNVDEANYQGVMGGPMTGAAPPQSNLRTVTTAEDVTNSLGGADSGTVVEPTMKKTKYQHGSTSQISGGGAPGASLPHRTRSAHSQFAQSHGGEGHREGAAQFRSKSHSLHSHLNGNNQQPHGQQSSKALANATPEKKQNTRALSQAEQEKRRFLRSKQMNPMDFIDENKFLYLNVLGSGSYGKVFKAIEKETKKTVAIKIIDNVFNKTEDSKRIFREIFLLKRLHNPYIIHLRDIILPNDTTSASMVLEYNKLGLVMDYVDTDLFRLVRSNQYLKINHVQFIMFQLLNALNYLHFNKIVHRDLKPANVLIYSNCKIKICDFGLARVIDDNEDTVEEDVKKMEAELIDKVDDPLVPDTNTKETTRVGSEGTSNTESPASRTQSAKSMKDAEKKEGLTSSKDSSKLLNRKLTKHVVTRWYRAPELILLLRYGTKIDIWSAGCILGELLQMISTPFLKRTPLFPGKSCFPLTAEHEQVYQNQTDQLNEIFKLIGTPIYEDIAELHSVKGYLMSLEKKDPVDMSMLFPGIAADALNLLQKMLFFNPKKRSTAEQSLLTVFFQQKKKFKVSVERCSEELKGCEEDSIKGVDIEGYKRLIAAEASQELKPS